jgi:vitamin B12 transporter
VFHTAQPLPIKGGKVIGLILSITYEPGYRPNAGIGMYRRSRLQYFPHVLGRSTLHEKLQMKFTLNRITSCLLATAISASTLAQENLETIVITGARSPIEKMHLAGTVHIIDSQMIEASKAIDVADLLRGLGGVSISQSGGKGALSEIRVRGSESNHVLVLIDGVEVNDLGQGDLANFAHLSLNNVERIEILKGSQSALWGSGAVGGVINIISKKGQGQTSATLHAELGEADSQRIAASVNGSKEALSYSGSISHFETDGQNISLSGAEKDGYRNDQLSANLNYQLSAESSLSFGIRYLEAKNEFDDFVPSDADNHTDVEQTNLRLIWSYAPRDNIWQQELGFHYTANQNENFANQIFDNSNESDKRRLYWQNQFNYHQDGSIILVAEHAVEDFQYAGPTDFGDPNQRQTNTINSLIADWFQQINGHLSATFSARYDNNSEYDNAESYRAGLSYRPSEEIKLFISAGQSVKNPTFTEIFGFFPASFTPNPELEPETSKSWEVGAQVNFSADWQAEISLYDTQLESEIITVFAADFTSSSVNADGKSNRKGVDLSVSGHFGSVIVDFNYGYIDAHQPTSFGSGQTREQRRSQNTASIALNYRFDNDKANFYMQGAYQSRQLDTDFNTFSTVSLGGYTLVNATLSYQLDDAWEVYFRAENLADKKYQDIVGFSGEERRIYLGAKLTF